MTVYALQADFFILLLQQSSESFWVVFVFSFCSSLAIWMYCGIELWSHPVRPRYIFSSYRSAGKCLIWIALIFSADVDMPSEFICWLRSDTEEYSKKLFFGFSTTQWFWKVIKTCWRCLKCSASVLKKIIILLIYAFA